MRTNREAFAMKLTVQENVRLQRREISIEKAMERLLPGEELIPPTMKEVVRRVWDAYWPEIPNVRSPESGSKRINLTYLYHINSTMTITRSRLSNCFTRNDCL